MEPRRRPVVLVAEPQALPGMWLEDVLTDAGCAVSGPYGTCAEAAGSLDTAPPDFAVISADLNRGPGFPLACALRRKGIPFALIAGNACVPRAFSDVPTFDRLFDARDVIAVLAARCPVRGVRRDCPMAGRIAADKAVALDQCPSACRA
ncbi:MULTISPECIES: histidine kinase [unclassified Methylobacterium]|uniref:histidine kinase n=1 Tax=unclassified Methylobacterium TaxID=2615210 RepID=UPI0013555D10|nr:histidine kinase [Methylobacterium sp. 2A]MWV22191.1 histidine kinase [Methylobacterium sp. 2A]